MDKKQMLALQAEKMAELKAKTDVDPDSMYEIIDECTLHAIEHFEPLNRLKFKTDYCFIMGKTYLGRDKVSGESIFSCSAFIDGDIHEFSHDLAELMAKDPHVARFIFHAVEMFSMRRR